MSIGKYMTKSEMEQYIVKTFSYIDKDLTFLRGKVLKQDNKIKILETQIDMLTKMVGGA